jgi:hypothetical protein
MRYVFSSSKKEEKMISKNLRKILILTVLLIAAHGVEEVLTGFSAKDFFIQYPSAFFKNAHELFYWTFHIMWWLLVLIAFFLILGGKKAVLIILTLFGFVYIFEIHHVIKGIVSGSYYSGIVTGAIYPILGFFYWKELIKNWRPSEQK